MKPLNIGINLAGLLPGVSGGIEFYIRNLLDALGKIDAENQYLLFTNRDNHHTFDSNNHNFKRILCNLSGYTKVRRVAWEQFFSPFTLKKYRLDLLHSPTYTWPVASKIPGVVSILDMLYYVYPEFIPQPKLSFLRVLVPWSARRCRKVLTISESSKRDIVRFLGISPEKVTVTPLALDRRLDIGRVPTEVEIEKVCSKFGIRRPYILNVGAVGNNKNPFALLDALEILHEKFSMNNLSLVISGNDYGAASGIWSRVAASGLRDFVCLPGYVPSEYLPALYAGALAYVSPSFFEGFGLTLLEAMAFGTPVVTSDRGSLPEVAGEAALFVNPDRPDQIADSVFQVATTPEIRKDLVDRGRQRVLEFSWERTARLTLEAYLEAVARPG